MIREVLTTPRKLAASAASAATIAQAGVSSTETASFTSTVITPAVIAAVVSATVVFVGHWVTGRREEIFRRRDLFAKAFQATVSYRELAYAIRRRRHDEAAAERVRLSEVIRGVQEQLAFHAAWIKIESPRVAQAYDALVTETRRLAGGYMRDGWNAPAPTEDTQMSVPGGLDFTKLSPLEDKYLGAVRDHLSLWRLLRDMMRID